MTIKAYRHTRHNSDRQPKQHRPESKRSGSFWGISWTSEDFDDADWDATPSRGTGRR